MFECSREQTKPRQPLRPKRVTNTNLTNGQSTNGSASPLLNSKRNNMLNGKSSTNHANSFKDEVNVDNLDFTKKILHTSWHPKDNVIAIAATNNLYLFYNKENNNTASTSSSSTSSSSSTTSNSSLNCFNSITNNSHFITNTSTNPTTTILTQNQNQATQQPVVASGAPSSQNQLNNQIQLNTSFYTAPVSAYPVTSSTTTTVVASSTTTTSSMSL